MNTQNEYERLILIALISSGNTQNLRQVQQHIGFILGVGEVKVFSMRTKRMYYDGLITLKRSRRGNWWVCITEKGRDRFRRWSATAPSR